MVEVSDKLLTRLDELVRRYEQLQHALADPALAQQPQRLRELSIQHGALENLVQQYRRWQELNRQIREHRTIIEQETDRDLVVLARQELPTLEQQAEAIWQSILDELVTADDRAVGAVILEIRAGTGGAEAGLWAADLLAMYQRYAAHHDWEFSLLDSSLNELGGVRTAIVSVRGEGVWQGLGYEAGVHCVKRVPATETQGRIHTSTATVAVLPEPEPLEIEISPDDVQIDITTAQGPGGQNVNKVATAVKMIHRPTGIEVRIQESKSQAQNRARAWQLLRARVFDYYRRQKEAERAETRSKMIGSGERSERIRTYRYKENIVVDHRLESQTFNLQSILEGRLDPLVQALIRRDREKRLAELLARG